MPELPEVETIRRGLENRVLGRPILKVAVNNPTVLRNDPRLFKKALADGQFEKVERRGKMLIFHIKKNSLGGRKFLLVRLGMTGRLVYFDEKDSLWGGKSFEHKKSFAHKHCHIVFCFKEGALLFCDARRFGNLEIVDQERLEGKMRTFGPEPLEKEFTLPLFRRIIRGKKGNIKAFLLDQKKIAGIGNIYADEVLFDARIHPLRSIQEISDDDIKDIYYSIKKILKKAVEKRGTTFSDYVDASGNEGNFKSSLKVYGRSGKECVGCGGKVRKIIVGGRGTNFCDRCQK